ncbi:hypothetical protein MPC1_110003 [Methylocella tundrae]|nr:hypothetical protein MPC1_110003 [Methylocella tundrae]
MSRPSAKRSADWPIIPGSGRAARTSGRLRASSSRGRTSFSTRRIPMLTIGRSTKSKSSASSTAAGISRDRFDGGFSVFMGESEPKFISICYKSITCFWTHNGEIPLSHRMALWTFGLRYTISACKSSPSSLKWAAWPKRLIP